MPAIAAPLVCRREGEPPAFDVRGVVAPFFRRVCRVTRLTLIGVWTRNLEPVGQFLGICDAHNCPPKRAVDDRMLRSAQFSLCYARGLVSSSPQW
jgi:hypothetical protein